MAHDPCAVYVHVDSQMDSRLDYSYLATPSENATVNVKQAGQGAHIQLRHREPNPQLPAYVKGVLAWGRPPAPDTTGGAASTQVRSLQPVYLLQILIPCGLHIAC